MNATVDRIGELIDRGLDVGTSLLDAGTSLLGSLSEGRLLPTSGTCACGSSGACSCDIPAPCWMPRQLCDVTSHVCAGASATLRLRVTNCSPQHTTVSLQATGVEAQKVTLAPASISLGPLERGVLTATLSTAATDAKGTEHEVLIWVRGCIDHVLRWTVKTSSRGGDSCHECDIDDCQDYLHHWYDHFYCYRPCRNRDPAGSSG